MLAVATTSNPAPRVSSFDLNGALGGIRTHGLSLRRAALYPTELQALDLSWDWLDMNPQGRPAFTVFQGPSRKMVPRVGFEPTRPYGHYALNVARLPFRHLGILTCHKGVLQIDRILLRKVLRPGPKRWWAIEDLNLWPPRCERGALTAELTALLGRNLT